MSHVLLAVNDPVTDPRARARIGSLLRAGHRPTVIAVGPRDAEADIVVGGTTVRLHRVARGLRGSAQRLGALLESVLPAVWQRRWTARHIASRVGVRPVLHVLDPRALDIAAAVARRTDGVVVADPRLGPPPDVDAAWRAPEAPGVVGAGRTGAPVRHLPGDDATWKPAPDRHADRRVALCVRRTERTPGRYLESALRRAGVDVLQLQDHIDWTELPRDLDALVVVESPLPAPEVTGTNPGVPVAFWVHHGEHHVDLNVRLAERYGAHVVLMAHSWHLAHRFDARVERFPFAVAPELGTSDVVPSARDTDVTLVGSGLDAGAAGDAYDGRRALVAALRASLGDERVATASGVSPGEVVDLYTRARVVPNEGGRRHRPITMRVFEAVGAGAVLASERVPGLDRLLAPDTEYVPLGQDPVVGISALLADPDRLDAIAGAATRRWRSRHTYDHRVDELFATLDDLDGPAVVRGQPSPVPGGMAGVVDRDPEVQRIVSTDDRLATWLSDREVWPLGRAPLRPRAYEALVVDRPLADAEAAVAAVWRYVYATDTVASQVAAAVDAVHLKATRTTHLSDGEVVHRFDLHPSSYRV